MKFVVFGTGGVGGYFGGKLAQAGGDVTFIARGEHLQAVRENGLRVDSILGNFVIQPAKALDDPAAAGVADVVMVCTKAWSVPEAIEQMRPLMGASSVALWLGNGMEPTDQLVSAFGAQRVLGGLCHISSFIAGPGHIQHVGIQPHIAFGELDRSRTARVEALLKVFAQIPEIRAEVPDDIRVAMWEKFIFIAGTSAVGAVTRQSLGVYRSVPQTRQMLLAALREVVEIAQARGMAFEASTAERILKDEIDSKPANVMASMQKAIMEGRPSELDNQTGAVIRMGRELNVLTPTNDFLYAGLLPMEMKARGQI